ncbi:helix-turn-helix domain-containing protein [Nocardioides acrostichi]|uniref:helix-turn-helix domain-containing protein n=1 Tax=Nocardioides acrostichi TaxID=2784339 RepID=UPI001A9C67AF|nr:helix-turn-helix transcriptional regulator [Nocardioides acrostichi]
MSSPGATAGARVRAIRESRGLSLSALAAIAGIGKATLSELESGRRNPTLDTLYAIAGPLGVPLVALVAESDLVVGDAALDSVRLHVQHDADSTTEVYLVRVRPGATRRSPAHAPGVREQLVVLSGEGTLEAEGASVPLAPGVHHAWAADQPHAYSASDAGVLVAVDVIVTPGIS